MPEQIESLENTEPQAPAITKPITEAMMQELEANDYIRYEVINGELVELAMTGEEHSWIELKILLALGNFVAGKNLGRVYPGDTDFVLKGEPKNIEIQRKPDASFVKTEHVTPTKGFIYRAPDLAVEIISPSQSYTEIRNKVNEYFNYGTQQVWIVIPSSKTIEVFTAQNTFNTFTIDDTIDGGDLLPDFSLSVAQIFTD